MATALPTCEVSLPARDPAGTSHGPVLPSRPSSAIERSYVTVRGLLRVPDRFELAEAGTWYGTRLTETLRGLALPSGWPAQGAAPYVMGMEVRPAFVRPDFLPQSSGGRRAYGLTLFTRAALTRAEAQGLPVAVHTSSPVTVERDRPVGRTTQVRAYQIAGSFPEHIVDRGYVSSVIEAAARSCGIAPAPSSHPYVHVTLTSRVRLSPAPELIQPPSPKLRRAADAGRAPVSRPSGRLH